MIEMAGSYEKTMTADVAASLEAWMKFNQATEHHIQKDKNICE
jgi:hypothetical protein